MTLLLHTLNAELGALDNVGATSLESLFGETNLILLDLKAMETQLEGQVAENGENNELSTLGNDVFPDPEVSKLESLTKHWYKGLIDGLKAYNGQILRFLRNVVNSSAFNVDLDGAYLYPLMLNSLPSKETGVKELKQKKGADLAARYGETNTTRLANRIHLMRSIITHFFKTGHAGLVADLLEDFGVAGEIDPQTLDLFVELGEIVSEIREHHEITRALGWFKNQANSGNSRHEQVLLKFHLLQFILLLANDVGEDNENGQAPGNIEQAFSAYTYAKTHFLAFFKDHADDISPVFSLLLFKTANAEDSARHLTLLKQNMHTAFVSGCNASNRTSKETVFIAEILENFDRIREIEGLFSRLADEFVHEFCQGLGLSAESPLFQAALSGYVNLPNFHKYNQLQQKLRRKSVVDTEPSGVCALDLPFSLTTKNQFLFDFHPIFICPISKEQLMPLLLVVRVADLNLDLPDRKRKQVFVSRNEVLVPTPNPVVVFEPCRHLALKESIRQLGQGSFKCHYCYKNIEPGSVSDAYFIDL